MVSPDLPKATLRIKSDKEDVATWLTRYDHFIKKTLVYDITARTRQNEATKTTIRVVSLWGDLFPSFYI